MAISRDKKQTLVAELIAILTNSKMIAFANYQGLGVAELQELRQSAREANVTIKVVKNRLFKVAMNELANFKKVDTSGLTGQLIYASSQDDEVAPAQVLDKFAKDHPQLELLGGFTAEGQTLSTEEVKSLAALPSREQLIAQVVSQLLSPINDTVAGLSGNLHGLLDGVEAKATN